MAPEKIQPWKAHWVPSRQRDDIVEYGAEKGTEIIMDGGGGGAVAAPDPERVPIPQPAQPRRHQDIWSDVSIIESHC